MAANSGPSAELSITPKNKWKDSSDRSPEKTKIWSEKPKFSCNNIDGKVSVIYYLTRNGHLQHPHFIQVPLSSSHGLYLKDVMNELNFLRGNAMACMYSWSSKRSYKNGYVWQDLTEDDLIHPTNDHDYILKGSELLQTHVTDHHRSSVQSRTKKNQSWSSFENSRVYECQTNRQLGRKSADMATQTDEKRRRSSGLREEYVNKGAELCREELSPPSMTMTRTSSEGVSGSGAVYACGSAKDLTAGNEFTSERIIKRPRDLMRLITCGSSIWVKRSCGSMKEKGKLGYLLGVKCGKTVLRDVVDHKKVFVNCNVMQKEVNSN